MTSTNKLMTQKTGFFDQLQLQQHKLLKFQRL